MRRINRVLDYYYRAYNKAAAGKETARPAINVFKKVINAKNRWDFYEKLKKIAFNLACGPLYWPNTFPSAIDEATAGLLYDLVRLFRPEVAVEIGTAKGNSAIAIGQALKENGFGKLYTIDPIELELVKIAIRKSGLKKQIEYVVDFSTNFIPKKNFQKIDFVFIDGDHGYENVKKDFDLVKNLVPKGGVIAFHDTILIDGPKKVIEEIQAGGEFDIITLPTLSGSAGEYKGGLVGQDKNVVPAGISLCRKNK